MLIVPSIDIFEGKCVRLRKGVYEDRTTYDETPLEIARRFAGAGISLIHLVDLEGARKGAVVNGDIIEQVARGSGVAVQVGGGIRSDSDVRRMLDVGVERVVVGSAAVTSPERVGRWASEFGSQRFCIAVDVRDGRVATNGWERNSTVDVDSVVVAMTAYGIFDFISTDISRDGMLEGPNVGLYAGLTKKFPAVRWLASGGISSLDQIHELKTAGVSGVVVGRAVIEGTLSLVDLLEAAC